MGSKDERIDAYIGKAGAFARPMLERIRAAHHKASAELDETIKWSMPHFELDGIVSGMGAFKKHVSLWFWRGAELDDPTGRFEPRQPSGQSQAKYASAQELPTEAALVKLIRQAIRLNLDRAAAPGTKAAKKSATKRSRKGARKKAARAAPRTPKVLADALAKNAKAKAVYDAFPPSAKREYVEWITGAKREATRTQRLATAIEWMGEGKRRNWKYECR